jgi:hypothetical protein
MVKVAHAIQDNLGVVVVEVVVLQIMRRREVQVTKDLVVELGFISLVDLVVEWVQQVKLIVGDCLLLVVMELMH